MNRTHTDENFALRRRCFFALVACAVATTDFQMSSSPAVTDAAPRLPGKMVRTNGVGDVTVAVAGEAICAPVSPEEVTRALTFMNETRISRGLAPMRLDRRAQKAAEKHACGVARRGMMTHEGSAAKGPRARMAQEGYRARLVAENIAAGRMDLGHTVAEWSASPSHLANIVIPGVRDFGIGRGVAADRKTIFWAAVYAQPS